MKSGKREEIHFWSFQVGEHVQVLAGAGGLVCPERAWKLHMPYHIPPVPLFHPGPYPFLINQLSSSKCISPLFFKLLKVLQFSSVQSLSHVQLFATPWTAARQSSLSITISWSLLKLMSMIPSNHLILCHPLLLLPSIFCSIRVFSNESVLHIRWPKFWSFSFSISPSNEY